MFPYLLGDTATYTMSVLENVNKKNKFVCNELTFDFSIETLGIPDTNKVKLRFKKFNQRFNGLEILQAFDEILMETGKAFWKLDLLLGSSGEILDISNIKEIQEEWITRRKYVEMTYKGSLAEDFLDDMQKRIFDEKVLRNLLINEYSLCFFFKGLYNCRRMSRLYTSVLVNYLGTSSIDCFEERYPKLCNDKYVMNVQGKYVETEGIDNYLYLAFGLDKFNVDDFICNYNGTYYFDDQYMVESANACIFVSYKPLITRETTIKITKTK